MSAIMIVNLALVLIVIAVLLRFATQLHNTTTEMRRNLDRLEATVNRMEKATHVVADNLADAVSRADAADGPDGAAADAALRTAK